MSYQANTILVTGGAGFIGTNYIDNLLNTTPQCRVINLDCLTYAANKDAALKREPSSQYHFVEGDITNRALVDQLLAEYNIDTIVHFAAESHVDRSIANPSHCIQTNIVGSFVLLDAAKAYWFNTQKWQPTQCRFIHVSTDEVYGSLQRHEPAFNEKNAYMPSSPYSASKASADHIARAYVQTYGLPVITTHCTNNYGAYQHQEKLIPTIIHACLHQTPIPLYGDGSNVRDWIYVLDHCEAIHAVMQSGRIGETYNIGSGNEHSNLAIAQGICARFDAMYPDNKPHANLITFVKDRLGHDWRYAIDPSKIQQALGWAASTTLWDGLQITIDFYLKRAVMLSDDALSTETST